MNIKNLIVFLFTIVLTFAFFACSTMKDKQEPFLTGGEKIYLVKTDSVHVLSGNNRVRVQCILTNAYNVNKILVYWNSRADSILFDYAKTDKNIDTVKLDIPALSEKSYIFELYTKNDAGDRSIKVTAFGTSYGDRYISSLSPRVISGFTFDGVNGTLNWYGSFEKEKSTQISYFKKTGDSVIVFLTSKSSSLSLPDLSTTSSIIKYRSFYKPDSTAIDSFATAWSAYKPFIEVIQDKSAWKIIDFSSQEPKEGGGNGIASAAIDGNVNTFWHTAWDLSKPSYPHYFAVDMGKVVNITTFQVFRRQGNNGGQTKHQFLVSEDGTTWVDCGTFAMDPNTDNGQSYRILSNPKARYFKYVALAGPNFYAFLGEINVFALPQ